MDTLKRQDPELVVGMSLKKVDDRISESTHSGQDASIEPLLQVAHSSTQPMSEKSFKSVEEIMEVARERQVQEAQGIIQGLTDGKTDAEKETVLSTLKEVTERMDKSILIDRKYPAASLAYIFEKENGNNGFTNNELWAIATIVLNKRKKLEPTPSMDQLGQVITAVKQAPTSTTEARSQNFTITEAVTEPVPENADITQEVQRVGAVIEEIKTKLNGEYQVNKSNELFRAIDSLKVLQHIFSHYEKLQLEQKMVQDVAQKLLTKLPTMTTFEISRLGFIADSNYENFNSISESGPNLEKQKRVAKETLEDIK